LNIEHRRLKKRKDQLARKKEAQLISATHCSLSIDGFVGAVREPPLPDGRVTLARRGGNNDTGLPVCGWTGKTIKCVVFYGALAHGFGNFSCAYFEELKLLMTLD
jgi:hypothetical protein